MERGEFERGRRRRREEPFDRDPRVGHDLRWPEEASGIDEAAHPGAYSFHVHLPVDAAGYGPLTGMYRESEEAATRRQTPYRPPASPSGTQGGGHPREVPHDFRAGGEIQGGSYGRATGRLHASDLIGGGDRWVDREALRERFEERYVRGVHAGRGPRGYKRTDVRINEDVCDRLTSHPEIDASELDVRVENGVVTLSGTIDSRDAKWRAEDVVADVPGVVDVDNQLRVRRR